MKPEGMEQEWYERYQQDGWSEEEITQIWENTLLTREQMRRNKNNPPRYITCATYENAQKRMLREVDTIMGLR